MSASLSARLARLEAKLPGPRDERRVFLLRCFAGAEYDGQRERIVEALLSKYPQYTWVEGATYWVASWWTQRQGGKPYAKAIVLEGDASTLGALQSPLVRQYPDTWAGDDKGV